MMVNAEACLDCLGKDIGLDTGNHVLAASLLVNKGGINVAEETLVTGIPQLAILAHCDKQEPTNSLDNSRHLNPVLGSHIIPSGFALKPDISGDYFVIFTNTKFTICEVEQVGRVWIGSCLDATPIFETK